MKWQGMLINSLLWVPLIVIFILAFLISNNVFVFYVMLIVALIHSYITKGWRFTVYFFTFLFVLSGITEYLGVTKGFLFGKYQYLPGTELGPLMFGVVPIAIPITWALLVYIGIEILELIIHFQINCIKILKSNQRKMIKFLEYLGYILLLSFIEGYIITAWDFSMDPLAVSLGYYRWESQGLGLYFGIPLTNFFGWWLLGAFMAFCYFIIFDPLLIKPYEQKREEFLSEIHQNLWITIKWVPFICYLFFFSEYLK